MSVIVLLWIGLPGACAPVAPVIPPTEAALPATATASLPALIDPASSWIEVDLASQTVILHEGGAAGTSHLQRPSCFLLFPLPAWEILSASESRLGLAWARSEFSHEGE